MPNGLGDGGWIDRDDDLPDGCRTRRGRVGPHGCSNPGRASRLP
jgi:hypothetical protein